MFPRLADDQPDRQTLSRGGFQFIVGVTSRVDQAIPAAVSSLILPDRVHSAQVGEKERKGKIEYQNEFDWKLRDETQPHNRDQQSKRKSEEVPFISLKPQVLNHPAEEESQKYKDEQEGVPRWVHLALGRVLDSSAIEK